MRLGLRGSTRSTVRWSMVRSPVMEMSCLGRAARDKGQKRVPEPPARMTIYTLPPLLVLNSIDEVGHIPSETADGLGGVEDIPERLPKIGHLMSGRPIEENRFQ